MKFKVSVDETFGTGLKVVHKELDVFFQGKSLLGKLAESYRLNGWVALEKFLDSRNIERQDRLFNAYLRTEELVECPDEEVFSLMGEIIIEIDSIFTVKEIESFFSGMNALPIPDTSSSNSQIYAQDDDIYTQRTYSPSDYNGLLILCVYLKLFTPVISQGIDILSAAPNRERYTFDMLTLFKMTQLWTLPSKERLERYIEAILKSVDQSVSASLSKVSMVTIQDWILANCLFRKILVADVLSPEKNIASFLNMYIKSQPLSIARSAGGEIHSKKMNEVDEGNQSRIDSGHKVRTKTAIGVSVLYDERFANIPERLIRVIPTELVTSTTLKEVLELRDHLLKLNQQRQGKFLIQSFQYTLVYLAVDEIPMDYLKELKQSIYNVIAVAQYIYIKLNYPLIAALLCSQPDYLSDIVRTLPPLQKRQPVTAIMDELNTQYNAISVAKATNNREHQRSIIKSMNELIEQFSSIAQENTMLEKYGLDDIEYLNTKNTEIRNSLYSALIEINKLKQKTHSL